MESLALQRTMQEKYALLLHSALAVVHHPYDAEDAVQTACMKAWLHQRDVFSEQACLSWLRKIVLHECVTILRKRSRAAVLMPCDEMTVKSVAGDDAPDFVQTVIIQCAISTLAGSVCYPVATEVL